MKHATNLNASRPGLALRVIQTGKRRDPHDLRGVGPGPRSVSRTGCRDARDKTPQRGLIHKGTHTPFRFKKRCPATGHSIFPCNGVVNITAKFGYLVLHRWTRARDPNDVQATLHPIDGESACHHLYLALFGVSLLMSWFFRASLLNARAHSSLYRPSHHIYKGASEQMGSNFKPFALYGVQLCSLQRYIAFRCFHCPRRRLF